jgi:acyl-coenzyme A thioesterase PaaI-like protein
MADHAGVKAIQERYPAGFTHCYGCGVDNPHGLQLRSRLEGEEAVARFRPADRFTGGVPGSAYGGLVASLLDCHGAATASVFAARLRQEDRPDDRPLPRFVTGTLTVRYERPTPLGTDLLIRGRLERLDGRKASVRLELSAGGVVCASGSMIYLELLDQAA